MGCTARTVLRFLSEACLEGQPTSFGTPCPCGRKGMHSACARAPFEREGGWGGGGVHPPGGAELLEAPKAQKKMFGPNSLAPKAPENISLIGRRPGGKLGPIL